MTKNKMFPLEVSAVENCALVARSSESKIWHLRYGHLNVKGLKLLVVQKSMVVGLPKMDVFEFCEGYVYGKQCRESFPVNMS